MWGKLNDPHEWWNINDYEILCATYQHEAEVFLKALLLHLSKGEIGPDPVMPQWKMKLYLSISGLPLLKKLRNDTFLMILISSITSSSRLRLMLNVNQGEGNKKLYPPCKGWKTPKEILKIHLSIWTPLRKLSAQF